MLGATGRHAAAEATLVCQLLFLKFVAQSAKSIGSHLGFEALDVNGIPPGHWYAKRVVPCLGAWFGNGVNAPAVDSVRLFELVSELVSRYTFTVPAHEPEVNRGSVRPWIIGYIYERWINPRPTGAYFTADLFAQHIVEHALEEWLTIQFEGESLERITLNQLRRHATNGRFSAKQLASLTWLERRLRDFRLIDLSFGGGAFLVAASHILLELQNILHTVRNGPAPPALRRQWLAHIFQKAIYGLDIAPEALSIAALRLWLLGIECDAIKAKNGDGLPKLPNLSIGDALAWTPHAKKGTQPTLFEPIDSSKSDKPATTAFDLCVGNPPYIALSQQNDVRSKSDIIHAWNSGHQDHAIRTTSDLSNLFILQGMERLRPNGVLAYVTSRNFFDTNYGEPIRKYLTEEVELRNIFTLHDHPFTQEGIKVKANTVILSAARRKPHAPLRFQHLMSWRQPLVSSGSRCIDRAALHASKNWTKTLFANPLQEMIAARCTMAVGDFARVRMGVKSGCNDFFLLEADSKAVRTLNRVRGVLVNAVKNSREIRGFVLPANTTHRLLNLRAQVKRVEAGYKRDALPWLASHIYRHGIAYQCPTCQSLATKEHGESPDRFPHAGMCESCPECRKSQQKCDRPVDRLSTQGHQPAWYTLALGVPPLIAVQCIVDTEIGVFLNQDQVYVTDQFQIIEAPSREEIGQLLFVYLNSRLSHLLLEGDGLHRARFDGSFMLKIQVEHLRELPCPDLERLTSSLKNRLLALRNKLICVGDRKSLETQIIRDEIDCTFLGILGYSEVEVARLQPKLRASLEEAIRFRWTKTRMRRLTNT